MDGDLLHLEENIPIVQQCNCLCVRPHGLSSSIANRFPYANLYSTRRAENGRNLAVPEDRGIPGTVKIMSSPDDKKDKEPDVICLLGQWDYGKADYFGKMNTVRDPQYRDTMLNREVWFRECLDELGTIDKYDTFAFPFGIGCGLAGGNWSRYEWMIRDFAHRFHKNVLIVKKNM